MYWCNCCTPLQIRDRMVEITNQMNVGSVSEPTSCDCHVTVTWLPCDCLYCVSPATARGLFYFHNSCHWCCCKLPHVTVMWLSCECHVTVMTGMAQVPVGLASVGHVFNQSCTQAVSGQGTESLGMRLIFNWLHVNSIWSLVRSAKRCRPSKNFLARFSEESSGSHMNT